MAQTRKKTQLKSQTPKEWKVFSFILVLPFLFSSFLVFAADLTPEAVITLTNVERQKHNLSPLSENEALSKAAELKAADMIKNDYFAHTSPKGLAPWHWIKAADYDYQYAGENLAVNFDSATAQEEAWMKSKTHRENILNDRYTEMGVAVVRGEVKGKTSYITVALFGTPTVIPVTKKPEVSESALAPIPMVKGVSTNVAEFNLQNIFTPFSLQKFTLQDVQAFFLKYKETIFDNIAVTSWLLVLMSLTAPAALFVYLGLREIFPNLHPSRPS